MIINTIPPTYMLRTAWPECRVLWQNTAKFHFISNCKCFMQIESLCGLFKMYFSQHPKQRWLKGMIHQIWLQTWHLKNILNGFERNNCISCFYDKSESLIIRSAALISMNLGWILDSSAEWIHVYFICAASKQVTSWPPVPTKAPKLINQQVCCDCVGFRSQWDRSNSSWQNGLLSLSLPTHD